MKLARLKAFRQAAYKHLGKARDTTFELTDAVLLTRNAYSLADFSLSPVFRRKWPSIYESLQDGRPQRQNLMWLYIQTDTNAETSNSCRRPHKLASPRCANTSREDL
ncbi:hypothetical protein [uncultured Nostoc sp.]|uniref:hypothetical protein n=1 Tax=uncultured Nostoc sp. TaxID=340711 RepID=UPI0035CA413B